MINLLFVLGFITLTAGLYLYFGLAITLITTGGLLIALTLFAALKPTTIIVDNQGG